MPAVAEDEPGCLSVLLIDVSDRVRAEQALRERERNWRLLMDNVADVVWTMDEAGALTFVTPSVEGLLGYTAEETMSVGVEQVMTPESYRLAEQQVDRLLRAERVMDEGAIGPLTLAYDHVHRDGHIVPCEVTIRLLRDADGTPNAIVGVTRDMTERSLVQQRLAIQHDLVIALSEATSLDQTFELCVKATLEASGMDGAGFYLVDERGNLDLVAHEGLAEGFLECVRHHDSHTPQAAVVRAGQVRYYNRHYLESRWPAAIREGIHSGAILPINYDGRSIACLCVSSSKEPEFPAAARVIIEAIAAQIGGAVARVRVQNALRASEEKHRTLVETMNEGLGIIDENGRIAFVNEQMCRLAGYDRYEVLGRHVWEFLTEDQALILAPQLARRKQGDQERYEIAWKHKNGAIVPTLASPSPIVDERGRFRGSFAVFTDLSQVRDLQDRVSRAEKMEMLGRLAGGVAHDLNNILSGIVGYPDLLLVDLPEASPLREPLHTIRQAGERAAGIVEDLLTLTRRGVQLNEVLSLNSVVEEYLRAPEFMQARLRHGAIQVMTQLEPDLLNLRGSALHLSKVVMNLVSNAMEAMPDGGTLTISTRNTYVDRTLVGYETVREGEYVVLEVRDTGTGMSEKDRARIFEPFYTRKVMGRSGTGLGLTVVWGSVCDHNGYIDVESAEGEGSAFTIYLPATREIIAQPSQNADITDLVGHGETILVVDDIPEQREIVSRMLDALGYTVFAAGSGKEAVEFVRLYQLKEGHGVDLIVLDMIMDPGMDGLDTYRAILAINPDQRAIISSGFSETDRVREAQRIGVGTYIKKPYGLKAIGKAIKEELAR